jgi:hypothetical protein
VSWVSTAGLSLMIDSRPDTVRAYEPSQPHAATGKIYLQKSNKSRIPLYLDHLASQSSVSGVATVTQPHLTQILVPGRPSKRTAAPTSSQQDEIATWTAGSTIGVSTIAAEFRILSKVATLGFLQPKCDVTTT